MFDLDRTAEHLAQAQSSAVLLLARAEPHWAGGAIGFAGAALGVVVARNDGDLQGTLGWVALAAIMLGMALHGFWRPMGSGWRVHFGERRVEPVGQAGEAVAIAGDGWEILTAPGDRRHHIAIDLRHRDRGRVARLVDVAARRPSQVRNVSALADRLAERLQVDRSGPRL